MEHVAANIIAGATLIITVGFCVWFGLRAARRDEQYPQKIEYLDDGFVYHDAFGDTRVRWQDIRLAEIKQEFHKAYSQRYNHGKSALIWVLAICTADKSLAVFPHDFETLDFTAFITMLQQRAMTSNPQFQGVVGDADRFKENIPCKHTPSQAAADAFDQQLTDRLATLGHPASMKEINSIIKELEQERKQEQSGQ